MNRPAKLNRVDLAKLEPGYVAYVALNHRIGLRIFPVPGEHNRGVNCVEASVDVVSYAEGLTLQRGLMRLPCELWVGQDLSSLQNWSSYIRGNSVVDGIRLWEVPTLHEVDLLTLSAGSVVTLRSRSAEATIFITGRAKLDDGDPAKIFGNVVASSLEDWCNHYAAGNTRTDRIIRLGQECHIGSGGYLNTVISMQVC